jgi:hypothetical protein
MNAGHFATLGFRSLCGQAGFATKKGYGKSMKLHRLETPKSRNELLQVYLLYAIMPLIAVSVVKKTLKQKYKRSISRFSSVPSRKFWDNIQLVRNPFLPHHVEVTNSLFSNHSMLHRSTY